VSGYVLEIGLTLLVAGHAIAVVLDRDIVLRVLAVARDRNSFRARVDAILDELGNRLLRIALR
jgi:hypothetical protein